MQQDNAILEELRAIDSRLAAMPKLQPFQLPAADYLLTLPTTLTDTALSVEQDDPQPGWTKAQPFETPVGYFDELAAALAATSASASEQPKAPFETPPGYFDQLPEQLLAGVRSAEKPARKTVSFRPVWRKTLPWIAAAALLSGVWIGLRPGAHDASADNRALQALAGLDRDSIGSYVELHAEDFDPESLESALAGGQITDFRKAVSELQNDEIEEYLDDAGAEAQPLKGS